MILCVDFDGTCVTHEYPKIGLDIGAGPVLKYFSDKGNQIILHTMRGNDDQLPLFDSITTTPLGQAKLWFASKGIPLFGVNNNPLQHSWTNSTKPYAHVYIDDAALCCPLMTCAESKRPFVNWEEVVRVFTTQRIIPSEDVPELITNIHKETDLLHELRRIPYGCSV